MQLGLVARLAREAADPSSPTTWPTGTSLGERGRPTGAPQLAAARAHSLPLSGLAASIQAPLRMFPAASKHRLRAACCAHPTHADMPAQYGRLSIVSFASTVAAAALAPAPPSPSCTEAPSPRPTCSPRRTRRPRRRRSRPRRPRYRCSWRWHASGAAL